MTSPKLAQYYSEKDGDGRRYKHPFTNEYVPSVTTILKENPKDLAQWAANLTLQWCIENAASLLGSSDEQGTRRGRYRWKDVRDERAGVGDGVHGWIEAEHKGLWEFPVLNEEQQAIIEQWEQLKMVHVIEPIHTELTMWNAGRYAGTADGLWRIDGELKLIDLKTSKNHWPDHDYQLSALAHCPTALPEVSDNTWEEIENPAHVSKIDGAAIIHLRADKWDIIPVDHLAENFAVFEGLEKTWYAKNRMKNLEES